MRACIQPLFRRNTNDEEEAEEQNYDDDESHSAHIFILAVYRFHEWMLLLLASASVVFMAPLSILSNTDRTQAA